ncbi:MAG: sulfite exporter TauE/SafE family protein [Candidatus Manganitrophaceae bacterium]
MNPTDASSIILTLITLFAATVNGALGYGFSSITVPVALIFYTNRVLNPALVLIEVVINIYVLIINRESIPTIWKRACPILIGLIPGVVVGSYLLSSIHPGWIKFFTYLFLLPLIFVQAAGIRRPIRLEKTVGLPFGAGIGFLYSVTTISGPPLAVFFNNQGLVKREFRAALGLIRLTGSSLTAISYYSLGLYSVESRATLSGIIPSVVIGIPVGAFLIRRIDPETFRRICMSFDVWVVSFGLSRVLIDLKWIANPFAYGVMVAALIFDGYLLRDYFTKRRAVLSQPFSPERVPVLPSVRPMPPAETQWNRKE